MRTTRRSRTFKLDEAEHEEIEKKFGIMMANGVDLDQIPK
jgi:hypothetical protein